MKPRRHLCCALVLTLFVPAWAVAQMPAETFADVPKLLERGRKVVVRDADGQTTKGRVTDLTPTSLTLVNQDALGTERRHVLRSDAIQSITRTDSIWNGLLIGLGAGIVASEVFVRRNCGPRGHDDECAAIVTAIGAITFVPGGAVVGALIDKFTGNQLVYRAPPRSALSIAPVVGHKAGGLSLSVRF